ncbi:MAG: sulfotransferase [Candidatus Electrothrix sp. YB6]
MNFLNELNKSLQGLESSFPVNTSPPSPIFIIGVPRSGTTLISQLLSACADVGYVNNLMARFWQAPAVGAQLSCEVLKRRLFTGDSAYGQTLYPEEPHEFGGFWRSVLNYSDMAQKETDKGIDWDALVITLNRIASVYQRPVVYKVFQLYWHLAAFHSYLPSSKWIWVRRNSVDNALSLLQMRKDKTGAADSWFSARPLGADKYDSEPAPVQVVAQVKLIEDWIEGQLAQIPNDASLQINLDDLCKEPEYTIKNLIAELNLSPLEKNIQGINNKISSECFTQEEEKIKVQLEEILHQME